jgi:apolipoprotein N-acyltransferase
MLLEDKALAHREQGAAIRRCKGIQTARLSIVGRLRDCFKKLYPVAVRTRAVDLRDHSLDHCVYLQSDPCLAQRISETELCAGKGAAVICSSLTRSQDLSRKSHRMTRVAVVQQPPVYLNMNASMERAVDLIAEAAHQKARLVVFPETWLPGYPTFVWRLAPGAGMGKTDALFALSQSNSVDLNKGGLAPLQEAAREHGAVVVVGYQKIDGAVSGSTLFNSCAIIDADGRLANNHRKLMPTNPERMIWGFGDGSGLNVVGTAVGRVGTLICWENYMPLARYALYAQNIEIYVAPT